MQPKAFISYSWTNEQHQRFVRELAERLVADGVDVVLDLFDLREGNDKYAFMERMVTDPQVTHILALCDKAYAEKANARKAGVGTESQIMSKEIYDKVEQSKVVPIVCELADDGTPTLPVFFHSRIWIDFSSDEAVNRNWEQLIRLLYGKPLHQKPKLGKPPAYITSELATLASPVAAKFNSFRQAVSQGKNLGLYRQDLIDSCIEYADSLRARKRPEVDSLAKKVLEDCAKLVSVRDHIVDWVLLESRAAPSQAFSDALVETLERLCGLKHRPPEVNEWNDAWYEAHAVFVYETFLYVIAALLKTNSWHDLHNVFASRYLVTQPNREPEFETFGVFEGYSESLHEVLDPPGKRLHSPAAELIKRQAQRTDLPFAEITQAELLTLLMTYVTPDVYWFPQTLHYVGHGTSYPFFIRATQHKHFQNLAIITGFASAGKLREVVQEGWARLHTQQWHTFVWDRTFATSMNLDKLDTIA